MIDFNNIKKIVRIRKLELEEGEVFLRDLSSAEIARLSDSEYKKKKPDMEKIFKSLLSAMMCDEKGKLLNLEMEVFENMPKSMLAEIMLEVQSIITGEKKS
jgi:hypothetical protein